MTRSSELGLWIISAIFYEFIFLALVRIAYYPGTLSILERRLAHAKALQMLKYN